MCIRYLQIICIKFYFHSRPSSRPVRMQDIRLAISSRSPIASRTPPTITPSLTHLPQLLPTPLNPRSKVIVTHSATLFVGESAVSSVFLKCVTCSNFGQVVDSGESCHATLDVPKKATRPVPPVRHLWGVNRFYLLRASLANLALIL